MRNGMSYSEAGKLGRKQSDEAQKQRHLAFVTAYTLHPKLCGYCESVIPYEYRYNRFCSSHCSAIFNNRKRSNAAKNLVGTELLKVIRKPEAVLLTLSCVNCSNKFTGYKVRKYCSCSCSAEARKKEHDAALVKDGSLTSGPGANRRWFLRHYPNKCAICGTEKWMDKPVPLVLDHVNGNPEDNHLINLRLLCCNCDAQTTTYKGKNKGNGRYSRRQRYLAGKSF